MKCQSCLVYLLDIVIFLLSYKPKELYIILDNQLTIRYTKSAVTMMTMRRVFTSSYLSENTVKLDCIGCGSESNGQSYIYINMSIFLVSRGLFDVGKLHIFMVLVNCRRQCEIQTLVQNIFM